MKRLFITLAALTALTISTHARQPERGYRGFVDWNNSLRTSNTPFGKSTEFYTGLSTSHGYQFNPLLFVGAGVDYEYCSSISSTICSFYLHGRTDLKFGHFTPFGDLRIGYNVASGGGFYLSPSVGHRFDLGRKVGINLGVGLTLQAYSIDMYDTPFYDDNYGWITANKIGTDRGCAAFFSFRVGIDF